MSGAIGFDIQVQGILTWPGAAPGSLEQVGALHLHHLEMRRLGLPKAELARGHAIVRQAETGELVRSMAQVGGGDALSVRE